MNTRQYMRYIQYMLYKQYIPIQYNTCITYNTYNIYNTYQYKPIHAIQVNTIFSSILVQYIQIHTNTIEYMHYTYQYKNTNKYGKLRFNTNKRVLCLYWNPNTILKFQYRQYRHEVPVMYTPDQNPWALAWDLILLSPELRRKGFEDYLWVYLEHGTRRIRHYTHCMCNR